MANPKRHKAKYKIGDKVVAINVGPLTGLKGTVVARVGFFTTKYIVLFPGGKKSKPIKGAYLTLQKH